MSLALMESAGGLTGGKLALADAETGDVLSGKKFYAEDKTLKTGTMPDNGAVELTVAPGQSVAIPEGYHNGNGKVTNGLASVSIPYFRFAVYTDNYIQAGVGMHQSGTLQLDTTNFTTLTIASVDIYAYEAYFAFNIQDNTNSKSLFSYSIQSTHSHSSRTNLVLSLVGVNSVSMGASGSKGDRDQQCTVSGIVLS